jgi:hypothetical protein
LQINQFTQVLTDKNARPSTPPLRLQALLSPQTQANPICKRGWQPKQNKVLIKNQIAGRAIPLEMESLPQGVLVNLADDGKGMNYNSDNSWKSPC